MRHTAACTLLLVLPLAACGGSADGSSGTSVELVTNPSELPDDVDGLVEVYEDLMTEAVETLEGITTKEELDAGLERLAEIGPAFEAVMKRSESLELPVDEGDRPEFDALAQRMQAAMGSVLQAFPQEAMRVMNALADMTGGVGPR